MDSPILQQTLYCMDSEGSFVYVGDVVRTKDGEYRTVCKCWENKVKFTQATEEGYIGARFTVIEKVTALAILLNKEVTR